MKEKIIYRIDNLNRLSIKHKGKNIFPEGRFKIDENNRLCFWLNKQQPFKKEYHFPKKISLDGKWRLNQNHDLEIISSNNIENPIVLKINIISLRQDAFIFGVNQIDNAGQSHLKILKLSGHWKADDYNRLSFIIEKKFLADTLIFQNTWQINKNNRITYAFEKTGLKTRTKVKNTIIFEGFWQINSSNKITYILEHSKKSHFDFRVQLESPNIYPKEGAIKYRIGIGARQKRTDTVIYLHGEWKFSRKLGLSFKMDYGSGRIININFAAELHLNKGNDIVFNLIDEIYKPMGIKVTFTHRFLKQHDAELFLRLKKLRQESGIEAGVHIPF